MPVVVAPAAAGSLAGIPAVQHRPDRVRYIIGDPASCDFDSALTQAAGTLVKVFAGTTTSGVTPPASPT